MLYATNGALMSVVFQISKGFTHKFINARIGRQGNFQKRFQEDFWSFILNGFRVSLRGKVWEFLEGFLQVFKEIDQGGCR